MTSFLSFLKRHTHHSTNPRQPLTSLNTHQAKSHHSFTTIKTLVQDDRIIQALQLYTSLWNHGHKPDNFIFPSIFKASSQLGSPNMGFSIHNHAIKTGFHTNLYVANSLILFYGHFGQLDIVHQLFEEIPQKNVVTWTAVMSAYTQNSQFTDAVKLFNCMHIAAIKPNSFTMAAILPSLSCSEEVMQMHGFLIKCGFESDIIVSTAVIDSYTRCGNTEFACRHFQQMPQRNLVSWNVMISGYNRNGKARSALKLFAKMAESDIIQPDTFTVVAVLSSCSSSASLKQGKELHGYIYKAGMEQENFVANGLIDMYGKCGEVETAQRVFDNMPEREVDSWTALITCYGLHGHGTKAISIFERMKDMGSVIPNHVTFTAVLSACSHAGLLQDGFQYFNSMSSYYGIDPAMKHYVCIVDMLGRAGQFVEALEFINKMPIERDSCVWEALLGAASIQGDTASARIAVKWLLQLKPENSDLHVQLSNIYAKAGKWDGVAKIRGRLRAKSPGESWIQTTR